ncbi:hypothetical protein L3Q82_003682 [Scortum barcoo]|uniref:Uncharacterized protein n=1 Tax=Scortum barcoo TaxID=214431 RepID=A0ACB8VR96_9TELE|nr:hypothetical protein L3Q82_003682 [Scortum barcoo]
MCWPFEEVHAGTEGFSHSLQVGEGGFGVVYRATMRNIDCAVKRLKQDCLLDWALLKESFQTEVDKLSKFRHPNIVDLLGFSEGRGSVCLIYSYMDNRSLEDQLHDEYVSLLWPQRVAVVEGASAALQFLHSPPEGHAALIHGDVKSSNILLDRHLVAKLADFGLARCASHGGSLVLLEVLTGRRALEKDRKSRDRYLKDLVEEVEDGPSGSSPAAWRKQLDQRLITGGAAEPAGCMEMVALACRCLDKNRKKRPAMTKVFDKLKDIHNTVKTSSCSSAPRQYSHLQPPSQSFPRPPRPMDSSVGTLSQQMSKLGPLEDTYQPSHFSFCFLTPPHPLHSSSSLSSSSSSSSVR